LAPFDREVALQLAQVCRVDLFVIQMDLNEHFGSGQFVSSRLFNSINQIKYFFFSDLIIIEKIKQNNYGEH
jgi:hypothetical protein